MLGRPFVWSDSQGLPCAATHFHLHVEIAFAIGRQGQSERLTLMTLAPFLRPRWLTIFADLSGSIGNNFYLQNARGEEADLLLFSLLRGVKKLSAKRDEKCGRSAAGW